MNNIWDFFLIIPKSDFIGHFFWGELGVLGGLVELHLPGELLMSSGKSHAKREDRVSNLGF